MRLTLLLVVFLGLVWAGATGRITLRKGVPARCSQPAYAIGKGEPGYRTRFDADEDGVACDWTGRSGGRRFRRR